MDIFKRTMVFLTFLLCCVAICLEVSALVTKSWISADAKRVYPNKSIDFNSDGHIKMGLFQGKKELNVGYGKRTFDIDVIELLNTERDLMIYPLWIATIACIAGGLLMTSFSGITAVINTAIIPIETINGIVGLYLWNSLAMLCCVAAFTTWIVQFHLRLKHNVLPREDRTNLWSTKYMANFGSSFWLVLGAILCHISNIVIVKVSTTDRTRKTKSLPITEGKHNGSILLY